VDHNVSTLSHLSRYILRGRVAGISKEPAASIFGVVQEDYDARFFETSATWPSAHIENPNK
jgi:hypothetical protein